eukprot:6495353-Pyramimonas_sp.AAC.1
MCKCGCRGHCSLYPVWSFTARVLEAMSKGTYPTARRDLSPFRRGDLFLNMKAGQPMGFKVAA